MASNLLKQYIQETNEIINSEKSDPQIEECELRGNFMYGSGEYFNGMSSEEVQEELFTLFESPLDYTYDTFRRDDTPKGWRFVLDKTEKSEEDSFFQVTILILDDNHNFYGWLGNNEIAEYITDDV